MLRDRCYLSLLLILTAIIHCTMTSTRNKVTAIIPTYNEEVNIGQAIESVLWADEIIVVDSFSKDKTVEIAESYDNVNVIQHEYVNSATQKNWIIPQAKHEWVFILDADEVVTSELEQEILNTLRNPNKTAYWIKRRTVFMGEEVKYGSWRSDKVVRLFLRDECRYQDKKVHSEIETEGEIGILNNHLRHYTWKGINEFIVKVNWYSTWKAYDKIENGKPTGFFVTTVIKPFWRFIYEYLVRFGFLNGKVGFHIAILSAYDVYSRGLKIQLIKNGEAIAKDRI